MIIWRRKNEEKQMEKGHSTLFKHNGNIYRQHDPGTGIWILAAGTGNGISVCDGDGDEHGSCIIWKECRRGSLPGKYYEDHDNADRHWKRKDGRYRYFFSGCGIQKWGRHLPYFKRFRGADDLRAVSLRSHARICKWMCLCRCRAYRRWWCQQVCRYDEWKGKRIRMYEYAF